MKSDEILIKTFDQVIKHNFDQTPILLENFDQVIRSSEIRSSDPLSHFGVSRYFQLSTVLPNSIFDTFIGHRFWQLFFCNYVLTIFLDSSFGAYFNQFIPFSPGDYFFDLNYRLI